MLKDSENKLTIKIFYKEDGGEITDILRKSLMLWIEKEVKELCQKSS